MLRIDEIVWMEQFVEKIERKHGVSVDEVEETLVNRPRIQRFERGDVKGEDLYRALGRSDSGRYLAVFFVRKAANRALIISARDLGEGERKSYAKRKA